VDFIIIMFSVVGLILVVALVSACHNHFKVLSVISKWYKKTYPEVSTTASGHLIRVIQGPVLNDYKLSKTILGKGTSGVCRQGTHIKSKKNFAIKIIKMDDDSVAEFYKREIDILKNLEHLNIIRVFEAYEEVGSLGLVMELCNGGHLGEVIADTPYGRLDESHAQRYVCQLVGAIQHCHQNGICHRDIKLQNILLETRTSDAQVKLIDFGNAKRFSTIKGADAPSFRTIAGTTYAMAPEVFRKDYDEKCDVWSLGVVAFIMLCGHKPFESIDLPNHLEVAKSSLVANIMMGRYSFQHPAWEFISEEAMLFIMSCFTMNRLQRPSASQLFQNKWCSPHNINDKLSDTKLKLYTRKLSKISGQSLSQTSMLAVAFSMPTNQAKDLRTLFQSIDKDGSGMVDRQEFCTYLRIAEPKTTIEEANTLFDAIDQDGNQELSFLEFVASMVDSRTVNTSEINQAFSLLDQEGKGYISHNDLYRLLAANSTCRSPPVLASESSTESINTTSSLSKIGLLSLPSFGGGKTTKESPEASVPLNIMTRRKSQETSIGDIVIPQYLPQEMENARLAKLQCKVSDIIDEADTDGDGRISYAEFLLAMTSTSKPAIPQPPSASQSPSITPARRSPRPSIELQASKSSVGFENYDPKNMLLNSFSDYDRSGRCPQSPP